MKSGIYQIKNIINNKIYIGSSVDIKRRWSEHRSDLKKMKHHSIHLQRAWYHYGEDVFIFTILEDVGEPDLLIEREQHYLDLYKPYKREIGYNSCPNAGSRLGFKHSEESKKKMSKSKIGSKHSEETKRKIGNAQKGKLISDETKSKLRVSARKRWERPNACSQETRKKMSEARKGRKPWNTGIETPQEVKDKISKTLKGRPSPMKGKKHSEETKEIMSKMRSGEKNAKSIMTWEKVREIRRLYAAGGISQQKLADQFGCSKGCIKHILKNRTWREE